MLLNGLGPQPVGKKLWASQMQNLAPKSHDTDCNEKRYFQCIWRFTIFGLASACSSLVRLKLYSRLLIILKHIKAQKDTIFIHRGRRNRENPFAD